MTALGSDEQPQALLEHLNDDDVANTPHQTEGQDCYAIKYPKAAGQYVIFQPVRQVLMFMSASPIAKVDMGFAPSRLLELLISRADKIVTRDEIMEYAWPDRIVTQNSLNQAIKSVREWLGDDKAKDIIQTVPRRGYQFNSSFLTIPDELPLSAELDADIPIDIPILKPSPSSTTRAMFSLHFWPLVNAALLLLVLCLGGSLLWRLDLDLLWQPGLVTSEQQVAAQRLLYTAPDQARLEALQTELVPLRERLLKFADMPATLLFNRMHGFYELMCINQNSTSKFMVFHTSQLSLVTDKQLLECLK